MSSFSPREHAPIYVGPKPVPELIEAVATAGGRITDDPSKAEAIVWYGGSPERFGEIDNDGVRWVQLPSAGVESWFAAGVLSESKVFTTAVGSYAEAVAEHALALMLACVRQIHTLARQQTWTQTAVGTLFGGTVGIVGCGGIGRALIDLLKPFRSTILAVTRSGSSVPGAARTFTPDQLDSVLATSDLIVLGAPATRETAAMIGEHELKVMPSHACLINIARGSLVDTVVLTRALRSGEIAAAGLDVTDPEPLPDGHPLWTEPRALITPHSANPAHLLLPRLAERVRDNVRHYLAGEPLEGVIDIARGY